MNTDSNTGVEIDISDDLDLFSQELFGTGKPKEESVDKVETDEEDTLAPAEDTIEKEPKKVEDEDNEDPEDDEEVDGDETSKFKIKTKLTARERIQQLNEKFREEERRRIAVEERLLELERKATDKVVEKPSESTLKAPSHDEKLEDGSDKYPLGEYDPDYILALHKHAAETTRYELAAEIQKQQEEAQKTALVNEVVSTWNTKVVEASERLPDLQERADALEDQFAGYDPQIVESLAMTIMSLDNGPDVLYYLSENPEEAREIAKGGPRALVMLGRLDSMVQPKAKKVEPVKVTEAPEPPPSRSRGVQGRFTPSADTDNLEDFEKVFYQK